VIGDFAVDLKVLADAGAFQGEFLGKHATHVFSQVGSCIKSFVNEIVPSMQFSLCSRPRIGISDTL
jgi:hypothetical protein